jgi:nicotinamide-nucleotide amidase
MNAALVTVGDELLVGQVVDTNASWLAEAVSNLGIRVARKASVGDVHYDIVRILRDLAAVSDVLIVTGGLGPTHDDVTRFAAAEVMGVELEFHPELLDRIVERFGRLGKKAPESNRVQAMIPRGSGVLSNPIGSAVGFFGEMPGKGPTLFVLPGVPLEMRRMFLDQVRPVLKTMPGRLPVTRRTIVTAGIGESHLQDRLRPLLKEWGEAAQTAYLPSLGTVRLRITVSRPTRSDSEDDAARLVAQIVQMLGTHIVSEDGEDIETVVARLLIAAGSTVAVAESCTAGRVVDLLTRVSGASSFLLGGVIAYSNDVKARLLGVPNDVLGSFGAVSEPVAAAMAEGVRSLLGSDVGVSTTGIMGPTGGTASKPVGTLCIALADRSGTVVRALRLGGDREQNKQRAAVAALDMLRLRLLEASA